MQQWLGIAPLAAFTLRRIEARGWHVSARFLNDTIEFHAVRSEPMEAHIARCEDGCEPRHQLRAAKLLAEAIGLADFVGGDGEEA